MNGEVEHEKPSLRAQLEIEVPEAPLVEPSVEEKPKGGQQGFERRWLLPAILVVLLVVAAGLSLMILWLVHTGKKSAGCKWTGEELPHWVRPSAYRVHLDVEWDKPYLVQGRSEVDVAVHKSTSCVVIHAKEMNVSFVSLTDMQAGKVMYDDSYGRILVEFPTALPKPQTTIQFSFQYYLTTHAHGFYRSEFTDEEGSLKHVALTQFEARGARKSFPCFDDPHRKASFEISLTTPSHLSCLGNMPLKRVEQVGSRKRHIFEPTPKMATYLNAWTLSDFAHVQQQVNTTSGVKPIRVWGPKENVQDLEEALKITSRVIPYYEELFQMPYALPKLDLITIPHYSSAGMRNWGLITFQMADLLINPQYSSSHEWTRVAQQIAHECAYMWFGNLVTLEQWGDLWLSDGFADYFQFFGSEVGLPGLDLFASFFASENVDGIKNEAAKHAHPLSTAKANKHANGVQKTHYDDITYKKGSSILRMLHTYMNRASTSLESPSLAGNKIDYSDQFLEGIRAYLKHFKFKNAGTHELWKVMSTATGLPISDWMHKWSFEQGFPVISVDVDSNNTVSLKQHTLHSHGCPSGSGWWIPVSFTTKATRETKWTVLNNCKKVVLTTLEDETDFPVVNYGRVGYYRVKYSDQIKSRLIRSVADENSVLGSEDITGMLVDAYNPDMVNHANITDFLELSLLLGQRSDATYSPWSYCLEQLRHIIRLLSLEHEECAELGANFVVQNITSPAMSNMFHPLDYDQGMLQGDMIYYSGTFGDQNIITAGTKSLLESQIVDVDLRKGYYRAALANGGVDLYNKAMDLYLSEVEIHEKRRLMYALGSSTEPALIKRTLKLAVSKDVPKQDTISLLLFISGTSKIAAEMTLNFVIQHHKLIGHKLGSSKKHESPVQSTLIPGLAWRFASDEKIQRIKKFYEDHSHAHGHHEKKALAVNTIHANRMWLSKHAQEACNWFARQ